MCSSSISPGECSDFLVPNRMIINRINVIQSQIVVVPTEADFDQENARGGKEYSAPVTDEEVFWRGACHTQEEEDSGNVADQKGKICAQSICRASLHSRPCLRGFSNLSVTIPRPSEISYDHQCYLCAESSDCKF